MAENKIGFGVLGPLQMTVDGAPVSLGTPKQRAVLAMFGVASIASTARCFGVPSNTGAPWAGETADRKPNPMYFCQPSAQLWPARGESGCRPE